MTGPRQTAAPPGLEQSRDYVQSLARGLSVLAAFEAEHPTLGLADIAARTGLSRAAVRRLMLTLQHLGYVGDHRNTESREGQGRDRETGSRS